MAQTLESKRLRLMKRIDTRLAREHAELGQRIAFIIFRAAGMDGRVPNLRTTRDELKDRIWSEILRPYYVGSQDNPFKGALPLSPYAKLLYEGILESTRLSVGKVVSAVKRTVKDPGVLAWLSTPPDKGIREMVRIRELTLARPGDEDLRDPFTRQIDVDRATRRLVSRNKQYDSWHRFVDEDGYRISDRVWRTSIDVRSRVDGLLDYHIERGTSAVDIGKQLEEFLTPSGRVPKTRKPYGTEGSYSARRLARTEITAAGGRATITATAASPYMMDIQWMLSGSHPKFDVCDLNARGGPNGDGVYDPRALPRYPAHPHCLCYLVPRSVANPQQITNELREEIRSAKDRMLRKAPTPDLANALRGVLDEDYMVKALMEDSLEGALQRAIAAAEGLVKKTVTPVPEIPVKVPKVPKVPKSPAVADLPFQPPRQTRSLKYFPSKDDLMKVENRIKINAETVAHYRHLASEEVEALALKNFEEVLENVPVSINVHSENLEKIIESGRFKSQFETRSSGGSLDPRMRAKAELRGLGIPAEVDPIERPIYGYYNIMRERSYNVWSYGDVEVVLKAEVRQRATVTMGDSLGNFTNWGVTGTPVTKPGLASLDDAVEDLVEYNSSKDRLSLFNNNGYIEAQVQGGVYLDDIDYLIDHTNGSISATTLKKIQDAGLRIITDAERPGF